jgi:hypothetical protein
LFQYQAFLLQQTKARACMHDQDLHRGAACLC